jgi:hypothetical protein
MNFGTWIQQKLISLDKSSYQLELDAELSKGSVYRWAASRANPRLDTFIKTVKQISSYSGEDMDTLLLDAMQNTPEYRGYHGTK